MRRLAARAVGRGESIAAPPARYRPDDYCARCRQGGPRGSGIIRTVHQGPLCCALSTFLVMENGLNVIFPAAPPATVDSSASLNSPEVTEAVLQSAGVSTKSVIVSLVSRSLAIYEKAEPPSSTGRYCLAGGSTRRAECRPRGTTDLPSAEYRR
jgi:hypothetical protein